MCPAKRFGTKGKSQIDFSTWLLLNAGNYLLSHTLSRAVQSAQRGLTSVFGMGTGGTPAVRSPTTCSRQHSAVSRQQIHAAANCATEARQSLKELEDETSQLNRLGADCVKAVSGYKNFRRRTTISTLSSVSSRF